MSRRNVSRRYEESICIGNNNLEQILVRKSIGIYFANTTAVCDVDADPKARNCVIPLLMKVSEGQIISMDEKSCN